MAAFDPRYGWFTPYLTNASNAICQQKIRSAVRGIYSPQTDHCLFRSKNTVSPFHRLANGNAVGHAAVGVCKTIDRIIRWQWLWNTSTRNNSPSFAAFSSYPMRTSKCLANWLETWSVSSLSPENCTAILRSLPQFNSAQFRLRVDSQSSVLPDLLVQDIVQFIFDLFATWRCSSLGSCARRRFSG